mgnify:CR=1 FL=1
MFDDQIVMCGSSNPGIETYGSDEIDFAGKRIFNHAYRYAASEEDSRDDWKFVPNSALSFEGGGATGSNGEIDLILYESSLSINKYIVEKELDKDPAYHKIPSDILDEAKKLFMERLREKLKDSVYSASFQVNDFLMNFTLEEFLGLLRSDNGISDERKLDLRKEIESASNIKDVERRRMHPWRQE